MATVPTLDALYNLEAICDAVDSGLGCVKLLVSC
jgi:hypothetical protein